MKQKHKKAQLSKAKSQPLRVAVAQINTTLGHFSANREKIISYIKRAQEKHCDLVVFPESTIFGYHPFDLLERKKLVDQQLKELKHIEKQMPEGMAALVGVLTVNPHKKGRSYFNSTALIQKGKKTQFFHKELLPTGDVFDEARFIENGDMSKNFFTFKGHRILITICEDIWAWPDTNGKSQYAHNPLLQFKGQKVDLILNQSASPFFEGKLKLRRKLVQQTAQLLKAPMLYVNLVGAQDEIIFDGASFALDANGKTLLQSATFEEDLNILDLQKMEGSRHPLISSVTESLRRALILGIRDFCNKTGLEKIHLGLSGGVDSALVACLAVDALGPSQVTGIALPSQFNSPDSLRLAQELAKNLGINCFEVPIQNVYEGTKKTVDQAFDIQSFGLVHENLQARIRGMLLMAFANKENSLLLSTSNKSEMAAGYSTLYGDMCGGLAPIGDLTKAQVYDLCAIYNSEHELIPQEILTRSPSAELRPNQKDQDSLPPYEDLDQSVDRLVRDCGPIKTSTDQWLSKAILRSEFKRWQAPPVLKISKHSFGRGRRYPIAQKAHET